MNNHNALRKRSKIIPLIVSFLLAFILWFYVVGTESPTNVITFKNVEISYITGENSNTIYSGNIGSVDLKVKGKRSVLNSLDSEDFSVVCDISGYTEEGEYTIDLNFTMPNGATLVESSTDSLILYLGKKASATVPVELNLTYISNYDNILDNITKSTSNVVITGPAKAISNVKCALVSADLGEINSSTSVNGLSFELVDSANNVISNQYITTDIDKIDLTIPVIIDKTVSVALDDSFVKSDDKSYEITPKKVTITGQIETLDEIECIYTTSVSDLTESVYSLALVVPDGVSCDTPSVEVSVTSVTE